MLETTYSQNMNSLLTDPNSLWVIGYGGLDEMRSALEGGAAFNELSPESLQTYSLLGHAVDIGRFDMAHLLLDFNADVNMRDKKGRTALFVLVNPRKIRRLRSKHQMKNLIKLAERMLVLGAKTDLITHQDNPLIYRLTRDESIMSRAIEGGSFPLIKLLVEHNANVSDICITLPSACAWREGRLSHTPLIHAIKEGATGHKLGLVQLLIDLGADLSISSGCKMPLVDAIKWEPYGPENPGDMLRLLLDNNVYLTNDFASTQAGEDELLHQLEQFPGIDQSISLIQQASVPWLTNHANDHGYFLACTQIECETANRQRKLKWKNEMSSASISLCLPRIRNRSSLHKTHKDSIDDIMSHMRFD